ncbi:MAG: penicillin-binding transpeptidase domain-containing protein, partial [Gemmiger sp.]|nr:penicillin-binding transpeptidase domain-containing protein [Gemmiger sp.]
MTNRRLLALCFTLVALFCLMLCRVFWVSTDTEYAASAVAQTASAVALPRTRGNFFDRQGRRLTGYTQTRYALCIPGDASYSRLFPYVPYAQQTLLYQRRNAAAPFLIEVESSFAIEGVYTYDSAARYLPLPIATHLLGYLDGEAHGVCGLELAYDDLLYHQQQDVVECATTAQGSLLAGTQPAYTAATAAGCAGVRLTLDADIQRACEGIAQAEMPRGCILVMETDTGKLLASASTPEYDPRDVGKSIRANDTSLINRALATFSAGSVFKVVLAAAAYDAGLSWYTWDCTGSTEVLGQSYRCAQGRAHGTLNLR